MVLSALKIPKVYDNNTIWKRLQYFNNNSEKNVKEEFAAVPRFSKECAHIIIYLVTDNCNGA